jgi:hypothetical protein
LKEEIDMPFQGVASNGSAGELPPPGNHAAVLVALLNLGTYKETFDKGTTKERTADVEKSLFVFELTSLRGNGQGRGPVLSKEYNLNFAPRSALRQMMEKLRGRPYANGEPIDVTKMLGGAFLVTVNHGESKGTGNPYAKIKDLGPVPAGLKVPPASVTPLVWQLSDGTPYPAADWVPEFLFGEAICDVLKRAKESRPAVPAREDPPAVAPAPLPPTVDVMF